jgi:hypothetical protein
MTFVCGAAHMLSHATELKVSPGFGVALGSIPSLGIDHRQRHGTLRLNDDVHVATVRTRAVHASGVVVGRIELNDFIAGANPAECSGRKLRTQNVR